MTKEEDMTEETFLIVDGERRGPLAYRGKENCDSVLCTRRMLEGGGWDTACYGWHCSYCDKPCSYQGHACDVARRVGPFSFPSASPKRVNRP